MRQAEAYQEGMRLIREHLGFSTPWRLQFNNSKLNVASAWFDAKVITISNKHLASFSLPQFTEVMLHEIAHALTGPNHRNHSEVWFRKATEIGLEKPTATCSFGNPLAAVESKREETGQIASAALKKSLIDSFDEEINNRDSSGTLLSKTSKIPALIKTCPTCENQAVEVSRMEFKTGLWIKLKCGHLTKKEQIKGTTVEEWISDSGKSLFPYQAEGINFIAQNNGRVLIADEPSLGKTVQALGFLKFWPQLSTPCLWICKNKLKMQTIKEAIDWAGIEFLAQTIDHGRAFIIPSLKLYIVSMDLISKFDDATIDRLGIKSVIADEIQHFKNPDSKRTQELRRVANKVPYFVALSGTPWKNRGSEYFSILNILDPSLFPYLAKFKIDWVDTVVDKDGKTHEGGIRNIEKFKELTKHLVIRRLRKDVNPGLPAIQRSIRWVELEVKESETYNEAEQKVAEVIKAALLEGRGMKDIGTMIMQLKHITGLAKVETAVEDIIQFLEDSDPAQKLTVFHHHIDVADIIEERVNEYCNQNDLGSCLRLKAGSDTDAVVTKFRDDIRSKILFASQLASGEGLNLQFCTNVMMLERQWNHVNEFQCELRFSRPITLSELPPYLREYFKELEGKRNSIPVPYLIAADTVDEMLTGIVERKRINYDKSMNDPVCSHCDSHHAKVSEDTIVCYDCGKETSLKWTENDVIKELSDLIIKKRSKGRV